MRRTDDFLADYEQHLHRAAARMAAGWSGHRFAWASPARGVLALAVAVGVALVLAPLVLRGSDEVPALHRTEPTHFGVLSGPRTAADRMPPALVAQLTDDPAVRQLDVDWAAARKATSQRGLDLFAVPAGTSICLVSSGVGGASLSCADRGSAARDGLLIRVSRQDTTVVGGLLPDGVTDVALSGGASARVVVEDNAFAADAGRGPGALSWTDSRGRHTVELPPSPLAGA